MSLPEWKGLWDWSMRYADGTGPSRFQPEDVDPAKMKWLEEALKHYMIDFSARMREIKVKLASDTLLGGGGGGGGGGGDVQGTDPAAAAPAEHRGDQDGDMDAVAADLEEREALLEELQDIVSSIDFARDLHKIGGLAVLLELLDSPHPSLRWRAAEVVATCVANNPPVQQWFLEGGVLPRLMALAGPSQPPTVRTKALLALSGLVRHFGAGLQALRAAGGLAAIIECLRTTDVRLARKAASTLSYMLGQHRADCLTAVSYGVLPTLVALLTRGIAVPGPAATRSDDSATVPAPASAPPAEDTPAGSAASGDVNGGLNDDGDGGFDPRSQEASELRQAALGALLQLAGHPATWPAVHSAPGLSAALAALEAAHLGMATEDRESQEEELGLVRQLGGILAAGSAPALRPDGEVEEVSVEAYEAADRQRTISVNEPTAAAGEGRAGEGRVEEAAGPPLLLGAP